LASLPLDLGDGLFKYEDMSERNTFEPR